MAWISKEMTNNEPRELLRPRFQAPWLIAALRAGFTPLHGDDYDRIGSFYSSLRCPLTDLNALMMIAWRKALSFHLLIEDDVLYMLANWEGQPVFWGPPIGTKVKMSHIDRAFEFLRTIDPGEQRHGIRYLWENHNLWSDITASQRFTVINQSTEYLYDVSELATLSSPRLKKKRHSYRAFKLKHNPSVAGYSTELTDGCLELLNTWSLQKELQLNQIYREKFELERSTCESVLRERLPLSGVVAVVDGNVQAFSIGGPHAEDCFNCMFEKTNLEMHGSSSFIFAELAKSCLGLYREINAGEDWEVEYLRQSKRLWKPSRTQASYQLYERR